MIKRLVEALLWNSRLIVLVPVFASMLLAFGTFIITTLDAVVQFRYMLSYLSPTVNEAARTAMRSTTLGNVIGVVNGYLLAVLLLVFSLGIYELFINKIGETEAAPRLLRVNSLDDLKTRLLTLALLVMILKFFQQSLSARYLAPNDLLYTAGGILLLSGALYLIARAGK